MNDFETDLKFDRVMSVEMFEHMRNHEELLRRISEWLTNEGRLFVHIFCHTSQPYFFEDNGDSDWMARHFFTGGMMPGESLFLRYNQHMRVLDQWAWNGSHYQKTCDAWLARLDGNRARVEDALADTYGVESVGVWINRWRLFFMACSELFGYRDGNEWYVSHYLFGKS